MFAFSFIVNRYFYAVRSLKDIGKYIHEYREKDSESIFSHLCPCTIGFQLM